MYCIIAVFEHKICFLTQKKLIFCVKTVIKQAPVRTEIVPRPQFEVGHVATRERSRNLWRSKQNRCTCISCGHCNIHVHDNLSKWHIDCWALHTKWYPSVRIDEENYTKWYLSVRIDEENYT